MFESQRAPRKGEHLRWSIQQPPMGGKLQGWRYGPHIGLDTHHVGVTKPCRDKLTIGNVKCKYDHEQHGVGFTIYFPWIDANGFKYVSLLGRDMEDACESIPFGAPIRLAKRKFKSAPVVLSSDPWSASPCPYLGRLKCQPDIRPFLLLLWKDAELSAFYGTDPVMIPLPPSDKPVSQPVSDSADREAAVFEEMRQRFTSKGRLSETQEESLSHLGTIPHKNGTHKKGHK